MTLNDRYVTVSAPAKAYTQDAKTAMGKLVLDLLSPYTTPHGLSDAKRQVSALRILMVEIDNELAGLS